MPEARPLDVRVYLITDPDLVGGRPLEDVVAAALRGGVTLVQLRDKRATSLELTRVGERLRRVTGDAGVPLIVNDRADVAQAIRADGVHVGHPGQEDLPPDVCRRILGPPAIVGVSVDRVDEVAESERSGATYVSTGPVYGTRTKADAGPAAGLALVTRMRAASRLPLTGIGGITAETARAVIRAGADGVAVAGAILAAADPEAAARAVRRAVDEALAQCRAED
jgi:thiamine-phosphate diphosphorylase